MYLCILSVNLKHKKIKCIKCLKFVVFSLWICQPIITCTCMYCKWWSINNLLSKYIWWNFICTDQLIQGYYYDKHSEVTTKRLTSCRQGLIMDPVRYAVFFAEPCTHVYAHVCTMRLYTSLAYLSVCGYTCQPAQWHLSSCGYSRQPYPRGSINCSGLFSSILQFLNVKWGNIGRFLDEYCSNIS